MTDYISREAVIRYLKGYSEKELNSKGNFGMITSSVLNKAERAISEMPTADVQPVKHGRWIIDYAEGRKIYHAHCSECGKEPDRNIGGDYYINRLSDYCPNCGSKNVEDSDSE